MNRIGVLFLAGVLSLLFVIVVLTILVAGRLHQQALVTQRQTEAIEALHARVERLERAAESKSTSAPGETP